MATATKKQATGSSKIEEIKEKLRGKNYYVSSSRSTFGKIYEIKQLYSDINVATINPRSGKIQITYRPDGEYIQGIENKARFYEAVRNSGLNVVETFIGNTINLRESIKTLEEVVKRSGKMDKK